MSLPHFSLLEDKFESLIRMGPWNFIIFEICTSFMCVLASGQGVVMFFVRGQWAAEQPGEQSAFRKEGCCRVVMEIT